MCPDEVYAAFIVDDVTTIVSDVDQTILFLVESYCFAVNSYEAEACILSDVNSLPSLADVLVNITLHISSL